MFLPLAACLLAAASTPHFVVHATPRAEGTAAAISQRLEGTRAEFEKFLGHDWPGVTEIRVGVGRAEFESLCPSKPPAWAAAMAFPSQHLVVVEAREILSPQGSLTLRHELTHAALAELGGAWPRWFHEGLAMRMSGETLALSQYSALFRAVTQDRLFHFEDLARGWPEQTGDVEIAYAQSASFVGFLQDRQGPERFGQLLEYVHRGDPFETAFGKAFHSALDVEERDWREGLPGRYTWVPIVTGEAMLWLAVTALFLLAYWKRRVALTQWRAVQSEEDALAPLPPDPDDPDGLFDPRDGPFQ